MKKIIFLFSFFSLIFSHASFACDFSRYVGYELIHEGTVTGYIDDNGVEQDDFEGCDWDRILIIDYSYRVECAEWSWSWAWHPDIIILSNGRSAVACIDDEMYDIRL